MIVLAASLALSGGLIFVLGNAFNLGNMPKEPIRVTIANIFTAKKVEVMNSKVQSAELTSSFYTTDDRIYLCYDLISSEPVNMTYVWYYETIPVYTHTTRVSSGLNCTGVRLNEIETVAVGHYSVVFNLDKAEAVALTSFEIVDAPTN